MKNTMTINTNNKFECECVDIVNDGTNRLFVNVITGNSVQNLYIYSNNALVSTVSNLVANNENLVFISSDYYLANSILKIVYGNNSLIFNFPSSILGSMTIEKTADYTYSIKYHISEDKNTQAKIKQLEIQTEQLETQIENHTHEVATTNTNGFISNTDKSKLDGIEVGANKYIHPTSHPASMIIGLADVATSGSYNDLSNKPSSLPANGGNADTVDGKHASDFSAASHKHNVSDINGAQANLGFTPVQQGGGAGQGANKIYIGWSGSTFKAQVDTTDIGEIPTTWNVKNLSNPNASYMRIGNLLVQWGNVSVNAQLNTNVSTTVNFTAHFGNTPTVILTPATGAPNTLFVGLTARNTAAFAFNTYCTAYAGGKNIAWLAIGSA